MTEIRLFDTTDPEAETLAARAVAWQQLGGIDPHNSHWDTELSAITMVLVDALLAADLECLAAASNPLRARIASLSPNSAAGHEMRGWLTGLLAVTRWALQRLPSTEDLALRHSSLAWRFLCALRHGAPRTSSELRESIDTDDSQLSRVGRDLIARGVVIRRRAGRQAVWELTPRGRHLLGKHEQQQPPQEPTDSPDANDLAASPRPRRRRRESHKRQILSTLLLAQTSQGQVRAVRPHPGGGWRVVGVDGRQSAKAPTKAAAVQRAREIVGRAGGGEVVVHDREDKPRKVAHIPAVSSTD